MSNRLLALLSSGFGALAVSTVAHSQALPAAEVADSADSGETIIVTGVRGAPRTVAESPAPIDVVGADKLLGTVAA